MVICMYGSGVDLIDQKYVLAVEKLGELIAKKNHSLIYGGGGSGLMGAIARGCHEAGGEVTGVVPHFMHSFEPIFDYSTYTIKTKTMSERKSIMEDNADGFVICPGGIGTFDEFFQILTLRELKRQEKPIVLLNTDGFYDPLVALIQHYTDLGFIRSFVNDLYVLADTPEEVIKILEKSVKK